jgi:hypothetical protein
MRFPMPHYPGEFEIPDDWLSEAGMTDFKLAGVAYRSSNPAARLIPMTAIEPAPRLTSTPKDFRGFDRVRLVHLLKGFVAGNDIEPVPLFKLPVFAFASSPYRFRIQGGFHRFYGSIATGFSHLPSLI